MNQVIRICLLLVALTVVGAVGFYVLEEGWSFLDCLYMAIITLTTVGYSEVHELSTAGRVFVMLYLFVGIGVFFFGAVQLGELVIRAHLRDWLEKRKMDTALRALEDHFIVCGAGRMGQIVCKELAQKGLQFVTIDHDEEALAASKENGWHWILGDATDDRMLLDAGIENARGLAAVLGTDADNLFVVFSARLLSKDIKILARASDKKQGEKMERAGADRVVSPYAAGASKIAQLLANPHVEDFMEIVSAQAGELDLAELQVSAESAYSGKALSETDFASRGIMIVGIRRASGDLLLPPPSTVVISQGDFLIALGKAASIQELCSKA